MQFKVKHREPPSIEIAPLIDVVFLLLLFFMVTTQFSSVPGLQITLPEIKPGAPVTTTAKVEIDMTAEGGIFIAGNPVPIKGLEAALKKAVPDPSSAIIVLNADKSVSYGNIVAVMDVLRRLKLKKLVITARWDETALTE